MKNASGVKVGSLLFTVKPLSKIHRFIPSFLPYWQGSRPKFRVEMEKAEKEENKESFGWRICPPLRFNAHYRNTFSKVPLEVGEKCEEIVGGKLLVNTGDIELHVELGGVRTPIYTFNSASKSWLFLSLVAGAVTGVLSILFSYLIH